MSTVYPPSLPPKSRKSHILLMKYFSLVAMISLSAAVPASAGSRITDLKNTHNDYKSEYKRGRSRCHNFGLMRSYAQMIMQEGDSSYAREWNAWNPKSGCQEIRLIIDSSSSNDSNMSGQAENSSGYMYIKVHE